MNVLNFQDLSTVKKSIEVEIPAEVISKEASRVTNEFARSAKLPGFRPGKVPVAVVRNRFAKEIQDEVMSRVLPVSFRDAIKDRNLEPVGDPRLEHLDPFIEGAPIKYRAEFEVKPHIELRDYKGLSVSDPKIEVTDADVEAMIERLRDQASVYRPETGRGLSEGDYAMITLHVSGEDIEPKTDAGHFRMGEESPLPELQEVLRGQMIGHQATFEKTYPEDAQNEAWRGKTLHHEVTLNEIRVQEKPEVTDEFAKSIGGFESVAEMRQRIEADIRRHREQEVLRAKRVQIGEHLVNAHEFELPEALVEEELSRSMQNYARYLASQGMDLDNMQLDWQKIAEEFRPEAAKRVKRSLILDEIAKKEGLSAGDVEVDAEIRRAAAEQGREFADVKHHLRHDGGYEQLRQSLTREKTLELLLKEATLQPA